MNKQKHIKIEAANDPVELLINACLVNDRKAQIMIYELHAKQMYNVSYRIVKDQMLAEDIIQEAFISAFKRLKSFKREVAFSSWLRKIVINKSLDEIRRQKVKFTEIKDEQLSEELIENEENTNKAELFKLLKKELYNLPDGYRIILSLYYLEGYDHEEISQILGITSSTSRSQLTRAKRVLSKRMTSYK